MLETIVTCLFVLGFPVLFIWYANCPLPDEWDKPKKERTPSIAKCYWDTLKK